MISEPTYLAAKMVSAVINEHFEKQHNSAQQENRQASLVPDRYVIEGIIDTAFWASLRHEEGYVPKISVAYLPPNANENNLILKHKQRLTPHHLVKLSPAVIDPGTHLGVWHDGDNLYIWGTTHNVPASCFVLEVIEAGLLIIKQKNAGSSGKFINIAMLKGDQIKLVDENQWGYLDNYPDLLTVLLGFPVSSIKEETVNILVELAVAMRRHGRGALMLVVPADSHNWLKSIVHPVNYLLDPPYALIASNKGIQEKTDYTGEYKSQLRRAINSIGGFSAIDGATVMTREHQLLAFGAKVARSNDGIPVAQILLSEPVKGKEAELLDITEIGGTRHLAAAQFVHDQHDAMAMVASQDGLFTVFSWSYDLNIVHAHRIDLLLM